MVGPLNPALEQARFCPRCAAPAEIDVPHSLFCPACGYKAFSNPKPVACAIPSDGNGRIWLARRGFDPGRGLWTFPGGYVELGETVEDAARREVEEELNLAVELTELVGIYSREDDNVVLLVYAARALGLPEPTVEAPEVRAFAPVDLPWDELAFWSTERALRDVLARGTFGAPSRGPAGP